MRSVRSLRPTPHRRTQVRARETAHDRGPRRYARRLLAVLTLALAVVASGCTSSSSPTSSGPARLELYTSVTQETVTAVVDAYKAANPKTAVSVFRGATAQLNARIAAEKRTGGSKADVIWATDPLSMNAWDAEGLLQSGWQPKHVGSVPAAYRTSDFWGTRVLYMVIVYRKGLAPAPASWHDLTNPAYRGAVEIADPAFAGSAFATLGYLGQAPGFGMDFYRQLKANGARQVQSPDTVVTDVAAGRAKLGITLEHSATAAVTAGSPVAVVWPAPGAISLYSPIGVVKGAADLSAAEDFTQFVLSSDGQRVLASLGWAPAVKGAPGPVRPSGAQVADPNWPALFSQQSGLLQEYKSIFSG